MQRYTIEKSSLNYRMSFNRMLGSLPVPGTPAFSTLSRGLAPFDLRPTGVMVEAPSSRLADVSLGISLLKGIVELRFSYGEFSVVVSELYEEDIPTLVAIGQVALNAILQAEADAEPASAKVELDAHLKLEQDAAGEFLISHLPNSNLRKGLVAEAFAYQFNWEHRSDLKAPRLVARRSLIIPQGLFVIFSGEYVSPNDFKKMAEDINEDLQSALKAVGLEPNKQ